MRNAFGREDRHLAQALRRLLPRMGNGSLRTTVSDRAVLAELKLGVTVALEEAAHVE